MSTLLENLNKEQSEAVKHKEGPLMIVAGAGTGKTTVLTKRIAYLIEHHSVNPEKILALTFTEKAANEMEERVDLLIDTGYNNLWIHTFHSFCEKILRLYAHDIGISPDFNVLDETAAWILFKTHLEELELEYFKSGSNPTQFISALLNHFSRCKDAGITPSDYKDYIHLLESDNEKREAFENSLKISSKKSDDEKIEIIDLELKKYQEISKIYTAYQNLLEKENFLDFGDLLLHVYTLCKTRPNILNTLQNDFEYICVDEFQDTNKIQYEIVKLIAQPKNNIMVVGDDDQSIYAFRGATIENILMFNEDFPDMKTIVLKNNYRSGQKILDASYNSIQNNNPHRLEDKLQVDKKLVSNVDDEDFIHHIHGIDLQDEVNQVLSEIAQIKNNDENISWSDFALLIRAKSAALPFIAEFEKNNIPYTYSDSQGLYLKPIIIDIISFLKIMYNFYDESSLYRLLQMPIFNINHIDLIHITQYAQKRAISLYAALDQITLINDISEDGVKHIQHVMALLQSFYAQKDKTSVSELCRSYIRESGILEFLTKEETVDNYLQLSYLEQFHTKITNFEKTNNQSTLKDFLYHLDLELDSGFTGSITQNDLITNDHDAVQILTIHASKGLEFKYVFIVNMVDKRFPTQKKGGGIQLPEGLVESALENSSEHHIQEERRLFYVAMTRAKKGVYFTSADNYGGVRKKKPSKFLQEVELKKVQSNKESSEKNNVFFNRKEEVLSEHTQKVQYTIPKKFSFTQLETYTNCPLQYKFKYLLKIPSKPTHHMSFGQSIHNTLQKFILANKKIQHQSQQDLFSQESVQESGVKLKKKDIESFYKEEWIDYWYLNLQQKNEFFEKGKEMVKGFYDDYSKHYTENIVVEKPFTLKIDGISLGGRIDRIDKRDENTLIIIDYKTGKPKEKLDKHAKYQLLLYYLAVKQMYPEKNIIPLYYYLENHSKMEFEVKEKDVESFKQWVKETVEAIQSLHLEANPTMLCKYCSYNDICEYRYT